MMSQVEYTAKRRHMADTRNVKRVNAEIRIHAGEMVSIIAS